MTKVPYIFLPGSELLPGHCVIINEYDRPCSVLVAVIVSATEGVIVARYLSASVRIEKCGGPVERAVPVEHFGVRCVLMGGGVYSCVPDARLTPMAKYPDGRPRQWQEIDPQSFAMRPSVLRLPNQLRFV